MKKNLSPIGVKALLRPLLSAFAIFFATGFSFSQTELYGLASGGGASASGTFFKMNANGSNYTVLYNFSSPAGYMPVGDVLRASDGNFYAVCGEGGDSGSCTIFRYDPSSNTYQDVYDF